MAIEFLPVKATRRSALREFGIEDYFAELWGDRFLRLVTSLLNLAAHHLPESYNGVGSFPKFSNGYFNDKPRADY